MSFLGIQWGTPKSDSSNQTKSSENKTPLSAAQQFWLDYRKQSAAQGAPFPDYPVATNDDQFVRQTPPETTPEQPSPDVLTPEILTPELTGVQTDLPALPPATDPLSPAPTGDLTPLGPTKIDVTPLLALIGSLPDEVLAQKIIEPIVNTRLTPKELEGLRMGSAPPPILTQSNDPESTLEKILLMLAVEEINQRGKQDSVNFKVPKDDAEKEALTATRDGFLNDIKTLLATQAEQNRVLVTPPPSEADETSNSEETTPAGESNSTPQKL